MFYVFRLQKIIPYKHEFIPSKSNGFCLEELTATPLCCTADFPTRNYIYLYIKHSEINTKGQYLLCRRENLQRLSHLEQCCLSALAYQDWVSIATERNL